jgi:hypothetical protein
MNSALQLMLLAPADDGLAAGGALLFPAWPCAWDVDFRLAAPRRTVVAGRLVGGKLVNLSVMPPERTAAITVLACQEVALVPQAGPRVQPAVTTGVISEVCSHRGAPGCGESGGGGD